MSVTLHQEHGVNPTMTSCYFCGKSNEILLVGSKVAKFKAAGLADASGRMKSNIGVVDMRPCNECEKLMKEGVIIMSIRDDTTEEQMKGPIPNPYRTGGWAVVKDEAVERMFPDHFRDFAIKNRFMFITDGVWDTFGIPRDVDIDNRKGGK